MGIKVDKRLVYSTAVMLQAFSVHAASSTELPVFMDRLVALFQGIGGFASMYGLMKAGIKLAAGAPRDSVKTDVEMALMGLALVVLAPWIVRQLVP